MWTCRRLMSLFCRAQAASRSARTVTALIFPRSMQKKVLSEDEVTVLIDLKSGNFSATAWGCDLTYDYVKINGDYRT